MSSEGQTRPANVLVLAPAMSDGKIELCYDLLTDTRPADVDLLRVVYHTSPERLRREWAEQAGDQPAHTVILGVDDRFQSENPGSPETHDDGEGQVTIMAANPNDVTGLGMQLNTALAELSKSDNDLYVCFDSITALLQFVDLESGYKFLHVLTGQLHKSEAVAHFHVDPAAHDTQTLSRLKTTFDDLVETDG